MRLSNPLFHLLLAVTLLPAPLAAEWYNEQRGIMGTRIAVELWHEDPSVARQCSENVFKEMHRIDALMSPYKEDSQLTRLNNEAASHPVMVGDELYSLIETASKFSRLSDGAFDITFAAVGKMYDYRQKVRPSDETINTQLEAVNYRHIVLNPVEKSIAYKHPDVTIDLGGVAKGYAVDNAIRILSVCGITHAMVSAGGDSRILGNRRGRPWMMGIQHPRNKSKLALVLPLSDAAISTSGDYERYFMEDGKRYHHIISPDSGHSARETISASVIGPDATSTDALSTTLFILGAGSGIKLIETLPGFDAIIIDSEGVVHYSSGLQPPR